MIPPLQDLTFKQRFLLTCIIVLAILLGMALLGWSTGRWDEAPAAPQQSDIVCLPPELVDRLKTLGLQALDEAFVEQLKHLYAVWMKDDHDQPRRARVGSKNAIIAYTHGRELMRQFSPPDC